MADSPSPAGRQGGLCQGLSAGVPACAACSCRTSRRQPAVPGQQRRGRHGEDLGPAPARYKPRQRGEPGPLSSLVPHPAGVPPQYRILMPEHQQLSILRQVTAEYQDGQAQYPAREQADDPEQHWQANQHHVTPAGATAAQPFNRVFERYMGEESCRASSRPDAALAAIRERCERRQYVPQQMDGQA